MTFGYQKSMKKAINQLPEQMTFKQQQKTFFNLQLKLFRHTYIENADLEQVKKLHKQSEDFVEAVPHPNKKYLILQTGTALMCVIHELLDINFKESLNELIAITCEQILSYETHRLIYERLDEGNVEGAKKLLKKMLEAEHRTLKSNDNIETLKTISETVVDRWDTLDDDVKELASIFLEHALPLIPILESGEDVDCWKDFFSQLHDRKDIESHIMEG